MDKVILISGKAENGKTSLAECLKESLENKGKKVVITRYAYYLKDLATRYYKWNGIKDIEGRSLLQTLGTDIIRKKLNKPMFHVQRICEDIQICQNAVDYVLIDDARFINEIYYPKAIFGRDAICIRINRVDENGNPHKSKLTDEQLKHISETDLDDFNFDITIINNGLKKDLEKSVEEIIIPRII